MLSSSRFSGSSSHRQSPILEGAPPLVCKGGFLRSSATSLLVRAFQNEGKNQ